MNPRTYYEAMANDADLALFNLARTVEKLAEGTKDEKLNEIARTLRGLREPIRKHMSQRDREATT